MFSSSTMASSTRRPTAGRRPPEGAAHERADGERQAAEGEDVERLAQEVHRDHGQQERQRDGDRDDDGRDEGAPKDQDDEEGQYGAEGRLVREALDRLPDVGRLVKAQVDVAP